MPSRADNQPLTDFTHRSDCAIDGRVLLVGSKEYAESHSRREWYADVLGVDISPGPGVDLVHDIEKPLPPPFPGNFDHVDCCSVLEHVRRPWLAGETIEGALRRGGSLLVSVPFVWRVHGYPSDYWRMTSEALEIIFPGIEWKRRQYIANRVEVDRPPPMLDKFGSKGLERTELIGWGIKR